MIATLAALILLSLLFKREPETLYTYSPSVMMQSQVTEDIPTKEEVIAKREADAKLKEQNYIKDLDDRVEVQTQKTAEAVDNDMDR